MWEEVRRLARDTIDGWWSDRALSLGAAIAFYTVFSLAPMLLMIIATAGLIFGREAAQGAIVGELRGLIGTKGATLLEAMIADARDFGSGVIGTAIGFVTFLVLATRAFVEIQESLNIIWKAKPANSVRGFWALIRSRLLSIALIASIGFLLLVTLVIDAGLAAASNFMLGAFPGLQMLLMAANFLLGLVLATLMFGLMFAILPNAEPTWSEILSGAILSGILFTFGKYVVGFVIAKSGTVSAYGASASVMTILLWIYYSSQILLLGAEFGRAYGRRHNRNIHSA